jgi:hypothetical protein
VQLDAASRAPALESDVRVRDHGAALRAPHDGAESRHVDVAWFDLRDTPRGGRRARLRRGAGGLRLTFAIPIVVLISALSIFAFAHWCSSRSARDSTLFGNSATLQPAAWSMPLTLKRSPEGGRESGQPHTNT